MALMNAPNLVMLFCILTLLVTEALKEVVITNMWLRLSIQLIVLGVACLIALVSSVVFIWQVWLRWTVKVSTAPSASDSLAEIVAIRLDPVKGLIADVLHENVVIPTLINPIYYHLLPSSAVNRKDGLECAVSTSTLNTVVSGAEPASLVAISNGNQIVGMGSRVNYNGKTCLLTANHVWNGNAEKLFLVKGNIQVEVTSQATITSGCLDDRVDYLLLTIPDRIWSRLGVKASRLVPMTSSCMTKVYGGTDMTKLSCSSGRALRGVMSHDIVHHCSTGNGWSGSPLYGKDNTIVGIHCGFLRLGEANRGVNVGILESMYLETAYADIQNTLIDQTEALERDYDFIEVEILNKGKVGIGRGEYYSLSDSLEAAQRSRYVSHDIPSMLDFEKRTLNAGRKLWSDTLETVEGHLNCQGAEATKRSPPSSLSAITRGKSEPLSPEKECPSITLESRMSSLEKVVEKLLALQSQVLLASSQSCQNLDGQTEALKQSITPCSSKPLVLEKLKPLKTSSHHARVSGASIQTPNPSTASLGNGGTTGKSRRRSRRYAKATSTGKPLPESLSVSSDKPTRRS